MEYFAPGFRELRRIAARGTHRVRLALARRQLAAAETELGLLGWQQADFDEHTEQQVDEIQHVEREQARLHNLSAELAQKIQAFTAERTRLRAEHEAQRAQIEPERDKLRTALAETEARLAVLRKSETDRERRTGEIAREQRKLEKQHEDLLAIQPQTPQIRDELIGVRDRQLELARELADFDWQQSRIGEDLAKDEKELANLTQQCTALDDQLRELAATAGAGDARLANELREAEKEKARTATDVDKLESAKLDPYREIGRVLADSGVAPANQPEVLKRVQALRLTVKHHVAAIEALHVLTAHEDRTQLRISLALLAIIAVAVTLLIGSFI